MISEALARLPADAVVVTATTDGFLSSVPVEKLDTSGPVAKEFAAARARISPEEKSVWEEKHRVGRVIVTKTRGTITIEPFDASDPGKPVLARAGYKLKSKPSDTWEECAEWRHQYAERDYETKSRRKSLTSLSKQCLHDADLVEETTDVRLNLDFDMKREPVDPFDREGLLCSDTRPWETLEQFMAARDGLEAWKKAQRRVLRTLADYRDMRVWTATREGQRASGSTAQSGRPPLVNAFMRAATRGELSPCRWTYAELAALMSQCGVSANIDTLKNARRRGELALGQIHDLTPAEITFARAVYLRHPDCPLDKLVAANSPAAADLAASRREAPTCAYCGAAFTRQRSSARYCGDACRKAANRLLKSCA